MPQLVHSRARQRRRWAEADDRELLCGLRDSADEQAFSELIERKTPPLLRLAARMLGDREEARDVVQLTFLRVWEKRARFDERWSANTWLYRIATNLAIDHLRSRRGRQERAEPLRHHVLGLVEGRRSMALADLQQREVARILDELSAELTERQRLVFLLREVEGLSSPEVARIIGCRESTVRNHLFTARKHLRRELVRRFPEYTPGGEEEEA